MEQESGFQYVNLADVPTPEYSYTPGQCLWCGNDHTVCGCLEHEAMVTDIKAGITRPASYYML